MTEVFAHWRDAGAGNVLPAWKDFHLDQLPPEAVPWCAVMDVAFDPLDFTYRFYGTARKQLQGDEYTGRSVRDLQPARFAQKAFEELCDVVERAAPLHFTTVFGKSGASSGQYHSLRMPLSDDGKMIHHVVTFTEGGPNFRQIHEAFGTDAPVQHRPLLE